MILQCPSCAARFLVADSMVPPGGRTVKCGKCSNQWFVTPQASAEGTTDFAALTAQAYAEAAPQPHDPKQLPALPGRPLPAWPFKLAAGVLAVAWCIIAIYAYFPSWHTSFLSGLYTSLGVTDTSELVFSDVQMGSEPAGGRTKFIVAGSIENHGAKPRFIPLVRVEIKDKEGEIIWSQRYPVEETLEPGGVYPFRIDNIETAFADRAASIVLDVGNNFELVMR